jgi:hypothetical protein
MKSAACRRAERAEAKTKAHEAELEASIAAYDPKSDANAGESDPMKTIFVSRLDFKYASAVSSTRCQHDK